MGQIDSEGHKKYIKTMQKYKVSQLLCLRHLCTTGPCYNYFRLMKDLCEQNMSADPESRKTLL